jgi:hypothetical protein
MKIINGTGSNKVAMILLLLLVEENVFLLLIEDDTEEFSRGNFIAIISFLNDCHFKRIRLLDYTVRYSFI